MALICSRAENSCIVSSDYKDDNLPIQKSQPSKVHLSLGGWVTRPGEHLSRLLSKQCWRGRGSCKGRRGEVIDRDGGDADRQREGFTDTTLIPLLRLPETAACGTGLPAPYLVVVPARESREVDLSLCMHACCRSVMSNSATPWTVAHQAPLSRQECWSGSPCPPPEDLPDPGIEPVSPVSCTSRQILYH